MPTDRHTSLSAQVRVLTSLLVLEALDDFVQAVEFAFKTANASDSGQLKLYG
jgi:hypothetical protein